MIVFQLALGLPIVTVAHGTEARPSAVFASFANESVSSISSISSETLDGLHDEDPFFLRAGRWVTAHPLPGQGSATAGKIGFESLQNEKGFRLTLSGAPYAFEFRGELTPVFAGDDYIILTGPAGTEMSSGFFYIPRPQFTASAFTPSALAVFYFPLAGSVWGGDVTVTEAAHHNALLLNSSNGQKMAVAIEDIDTLWRASNMNFLLAVNQQLTREFANRHSVSSEITSLPARSTAAFGLVYVGEQTKASSSPSVSFLKRSLQKLFDAVIPSAHALHPVYQRFVDKTVRALVVSSMALTLSVVLRYTVFRAKLAGQPQPPGAITGTFDVFAQMMQTLNSAPQVIPAHLIEYFFDRVMPGLASAENTIIRRVYNYFIGFTRATNMQIPVDAHTYKLGFGAMGTVDTAVGAVQVFGIQPAILNLMAENIPGLHDRIHSQLNNSAWDEYQNVSVMTTFTAFLQSGAFYFSQQVKDAALNAATANVRNEMRAEGKNPFAPENRNEREARIAHAVDQRLRAERLPGPEKFLFDANSIYRWLQAQAGYKAPAGTDPEQFLGITRQGLVKPALKKAWSAAKELSEKEPGDLRYRQAFGLLTLLKNKADKLGHEELVSLSFQGPVDADIKMLPERWQREFPDGAPVAASLFRTAIFGLTGLKNNPAKSDAPSVEATPSALAKRYDPLQRSNPFARWQLKRAYTRAQYRYLKLVSRNSDFEFEPVFREELLRTVNLYPDYQNVELMEEIEARTAREYEDRVKDPEFKRFLDSLPAHERARVETTVSTDVFVKNYVEATQKEEMVPATSPAQPGRFQWLRQTDTVRSSERLTRLVRLAESFYSDEHYRRGLWAKVTRDLVPISHDLVFGTQRMLRRMPLTMTTGYLFQQFLFDVRLPYVKALANALILGPTVLGGWNTAYRLMRYQGWKPQSGFKSMAKYALLGGLTTFMFGVFYVLAAPEVGAAQSGFDEFWNNTKRRCLNLLTRK